MLIPRTILVLLLLIPVLVSAHEGHQKQPSTSNVEIHQGKSEKSSDDHPAKKKDNQESSIKEKAEEHKHNHESFNSKKETDYRKFIKWIGNFHPVAIHFPIALIIMTGLSELLFLLFPSSNFRYASRFMIVTAAITAVPAALLGLAYGYEAVYSGSLSEIFWWHKFCGISTAILAIITASINELNIRKIINNKLLYQIFLLVSVIFVTITGYLGGEMTFGLYNLFP